MRTIYKGGLVFSLMLLALVSSCTEPYALQTRNFESALVIEATMTNELKPQQVKLSRTYRFEEEGPSFETGATVYVTDDQGNTYDFEEQQQRYVSDPFQAIAQRKYTLHVMTADGKEYESSAETLTTPTPIESVTTAQTTLEGVPGMQIEVNSYDPAGTSRYYRYEYEETYKIVAPLWSASELVLSGPPEGIQSFVVQPRTEQVQVCYSSAKSSSILLTSTNNLVEDRVQRFPVRFISSQDPIIRERYSILVRQYVQTFAAFTYYTTLKEISSDESLLSQNQPGFFYGNIKPVTNRNEKVIGFFEVAAVSEKRIFFNYEDIFPGPARPPYFYECQVWEYDRTSFDPLDAFGYNQLRANLRVHNLVMYTYDDPLYYMTHVPCGDCTSFSSNVIPSFWQD